MKIPFDIKFRPQIESGEYKVVIRDDTPVHILSFEALGPYPVCYQVGDGMDAAFPPRPDVYFANEKGECSYPPCSLLIVTPEKDLTEFEIRLLDWLSSDTSGEIPMERMKEVVRNRATELLALARKELEPEVLERLEEAYKNQDEVVYQNGKRDGKAEAMKDLPRWKKIPFSGTYGTFVNTFEDGSKFLFYDGYCLGIKDLEEKLPVDLEED